jgi:hypothetical protein
MNDEKPTFINTRVNEITSSSGFKVQTIDRFYAKYMIADREITIPRDAVKIDGKWHITFSLPQEKMRWQVPYHNEPITDEWIAKIKSDLTQLAEFEEYIIHFD